MARKRNPSALTVGALSALGGAIAGAAMTAYAAKKRTVPALSPNPLHPDYHVAQLDDVKRALRERGYDWETEGELTSREGVQEQEEYDIPHDIPYAYAYQLLELTKTPPDSTINWVGVFSAANDLSAAHGAAGSQERPETLEKTLNAVDFALGD